MTDTVPTPAAHYPAVAAELRRIADALDQLPPVEQAWLSVSLVLDSVEDVDAAAMAVFGRPGAPSRGISPHDWYHLARGALATCRGQVCVQASVAPPLAELHAETVTG